MQERAVRGRQGHTDKVKRVETEREGEAAREGGVGNGGECEPCSGRESESERGRKLVKVHSCFSRHTNE